MSGRSTKLLSPTEAAALLGVNPKVLRWVSHRHGIGAPDARGRRWYATADLEALGKLLARHDPSGRFRARPASGGREPLRSGLPSAPDGFEGLSTWRAARELEVEPVVLAWVAESERVGFAQGSRRVFGAADVARLRALLKEHDPDGLFRTGRKAKGNTRAAAPPPQG